MALTTPRTARDPILRTLLAVTLVNTFGNGLFLTVSALYFTRVIGLSVTQVGLGLAVAGGFGIVAGVPLGRLADRIGARRVLLALLAFEAVAVLGYTASRSFAVFLPVVCAVTFADRGASAVRHALIASSLPPADRVRGRARLRVMTNVGMGAGSALAAVALHVDTAAAYTTVIVADSLTFAVAALFLLRLAVPDAPTRPAGAPRARNPLADRPYLLITFLNGVLMMQAGVLEVGLPLWAVDHTEAPRLVVAAAFLLNTGLVVALQVRLSRGTEDPARAARVCARAGLVLTAACLLYAAAHGLGAATATLVLLVAVAVHTIGEILVAAGGWGLSMELADPAAHGAYQGVFNSGFAAGVLLSPALVAATALTHGAAGWAILAVIFLAAGVALVPATRWARQART